MSRTLVQGILTADAASASAGSLGTLGVLPGSIYAAESADSPKSDVFITHRWGNVGVGVGASVPQTLDVWAYDRDLDYVRIDKILLRVRYLFAAVTAANAIEGWITQIDWQGDSPDLRDDGYHAITRHSTFRVVGSTR